MSGKHVTLEVNGASIHLAEHGDGPPIVLIHGGLSSHVDWAPVAAALARAHRVVTPDSRGHGQSTNPSEHLSYAAIADDVAAIISSLGLERPVVGGWSDGGQVALELGARHSGVAGALIVGAASPDFDAGGLRETHRGLLGADATGAPDPAYLDSELGDFAPTLKARHPGGEERWATLIRQTAEMWLTYEGLRPDALQTIDVPVLVLAGDRRRVDPSRPVNRAALIHDYAGRHAAG